MPFPSIIDLLGMGAGSTLVSQTRSAGAAVTDSAGAQFPDWVNESNIFTSNDVYCTNTFPSSGAQVDSEYLFIDNFGFTIPSGATIYGFEIDVECKVDNTTGNPDFAEVTLLKEGSAVGSQNLGSAIAWSTTEGVITFGSDDELGGLTWTVANVNHADTGLRLYVRRQASGGGTVFSIDHVQMTVWYLPGAGGNRRRRLLLAS